MHVYIYACYPRETRKEERPKDRVAICCLGICMEEKDVKEAGLKPQRHVRTQFKPSQCFISEDGVIKARAHAHGNLTESKSPSMIKFP